jgi:nucleoside-diphosphate-sugar epimerase
VKIFISGATGVIGRRVVPQLLALGHDITGTVRSPAKADALRKAGARPATANLFDKPALRDAVAGHEAVVNLATHMPSLDLRAFLPGAWAENDRVRKLGSDNLVDASIAVGVRLFVQESFAPAYPDCGEQWIDETVALEPARYNRTLVDAERSAQRFTECGGTGIVLRFGAFYGPDATQITNLIQSVRRGWAPMPGHPEAFFSSISHDDAATAVVAALQAGAGTYNAADDEPLRRREYFDSLAQALGIPPPKIPPGWIAHLFGSLGRLLARSQRVSNRKFRHETSWAPKYPSVREGWLATLRERQERKAPTTTRLVRPR